MTERYDVVVVGAGPAGEVAASRLPALGLRTALIERELVGGECAYWACVPSKTLLRPPEVRFDARRTAGTDEPTQRWAEVAAYRDEMIRHLDDSKQVEGYRSEGIDVYKSEAAFAGPGRVEVDGKTLEAERIIIATGSDSRIPPVAGLEEAGYWTNREATELKEVPRSIVIVGGGPVGVELGQFMRRFGAAVTIVQREDRLLARDDPAVGDLVGRALADEGIEVRVGVEAESVERHGEERVVRLTDGQELRAEQLLLAIGREPRLPAGLDRLDVEVGDRGIAVDERCRAGDGIWAIGDVTGVMPFTHVGKYQAQIACRDIAGEGPSADYAAIPRVVFSDPEVAAVGMTTAQARERGIALAVARIKLPEQIARPWTYEQDPRGELALLADRDGDVLVGAWAVAPLAGEWIHYAALAIKTKTPVGVLRDTVAQFPTFTEGYLKALDQLEPV